MRFSGNMAVAFLTLAAVVTLAVTTHRTILSPGPLSVTAHVQSELRCSSCHPAPWDQQTMADRCLGCHSDVRAALATAGQGHGGVASATRCQTCHRGHRHV